MRANALRTAGSCVPPLPPLSPASHPRRQVRELSLTGNQLRADAERRRLRFAAGDSLTDPAWLESSLGSGGGRTAGSGAAQREPRGEAIEAIDCRGALVGR